MCAHHSHYSSHLIASLKRRQLVKEWIAFGNACHVQTGVEQVYIIVRSWITIRLVQSFSAKRSNFTNHGYLQENLNADFTAGAKQLIGPDFELQSLLWELQAVSACNHPIKSCLVTQNVYQQTYGQPSLGQGAAIGEDLCLPPSTWTGERHDLCIAGMKLLRSLMGAVWFDVVCIEQTSELTGSLLLFVD